MDTIFLIGILGPVPAMVQAHLKSCLMVLHNEQYWNILDSTTGTRCLYVTVTDTFDFTECKNPFAQGSVKSGLLWLANDIAYFDTKWGLLDPVSVEINVVIPIDP